MGDSWEEYNVFHHKFLVWLKVNGYNVDEVKNMSQAEIDALVAKSPYYKATANDIDWVNKVKMQGAIQKWVDHSISVTVNLAELHLRRDGRKGLSDGMGVWLQRGYGLSGRFARRSPGRRRKRKNRPKQKREYR